MARSTYVGTSGWHSGAFVGHFYPKEIASNMRLGFYAERFNTVELNSTFYHFSRASTFDKRFAETPENFKFAIKANRFFTHDSPMRDADEKWVKFSEPLKQLKNKLGPVLFQFPARYQYEENVLEAWLESLDHQNFKYTFELRSPSWHTPKVYRLLEKYDAAFCIFDIRGFHPLPVRTASWTYFRFHGPLKQPYRGSYSDEALAQWGDVINRDFKDADVYAYFDNTMSGEATDNALALKKLLNGPAFVR